MLLVTPPIVGAMLFCAIQLQQVINNRYVLEQVKPLVQLSIIGGKIVHELQKERGTTAGYIGSNGQRFGNQLSEQRQLTDSVLSTQLPKVKTLLQKIRSQQPQIHTDMQTILNQLANINQTRNNVDRLSVTVKEAAGYYTQLNTQWLALSAAIARLSTFNDLTEELRNYATFMQAKEYAGLERAILSVTFANDKFLPGNYYTFAKFVSLQDAYLSVFERFASTEQLNTLRRFENSSVEHNVQQYREQANRHYMAGGFNVASADWFAASTARINQFKQLEDQISQHIETAVAEHNSAANQQLLLTVGATALLLLLTLALTVFITRMLLRQTADLANTMQQVIKSRDLTLRVQVQSQDELGRSANSFNQLLRVLDDMLTEINSSSVQLATAAEQTSQAIKENTRNLDKQSHETEYAATATEEMTATVHEIANSTTLTADAAHRAAQLSSEGVDAVHNSAERMNQLNEQISWANTAVIQLRDSSTSINEIVEVIKVVAEQTNLLALNAAIEAARAGEHGRGFAVVADEVRTLAQRTQDSTQQIETMVTRFQTDANGVSSAIEQSFEHVRASLTQTGLVQDKLGEINGAIEQITDMCTQIATAAEQQVSATQEIAQNIRTINDIAVQSAASGAQISTAAQQQSELAEHQLALVHRFTLN